MSNETDPPDHESSATESLGTTADPAAIGTAADPAAIGTAADLARLWSQAADVVVLTGAGISTDSGISDFRGPNGLWTRNPGAQAMFDIETYMSDPQVRRQAWANRRAHPAWQAQPNRGHLALAELQRRGRVGTVVTQNIDGLHQRAGSARVLELHGTVWQVQCLSCAHRWPTSEVLARPEDDPPCLLCGGILKTATISFGQALDQDVLDAAVAAAYRADLMVAVGTSLQVRPAAGLVALPRRLAIVNAQPTPYDTDAELVVRESISDVLETVVDELT